MMRHSIRSLIDFTLSLYPEGSTVKTGTEVSARLTELLSRFVQDKVPYADCVQTSLSLTGTSHPVEKLHEIITVPNEPIPFEGSAADASEDPARKKSRSWTPYEDSRLVAGIYRYGADNWTSICRFVGNGRTRSQCAQRWQRGLDPRLSKDHWSCREEIYLTQLVQYYGDKSWTQIASKMGNRSDVQCRYHYKQMQKERALAATLPDKTGIRKAQSCFSTLWVPQPPPPIQLPQPIPPLPPPPFFRFRPTPPPIPVGGMRPSQSVPLLPIARFVPAKARVPATPELPAPTSPPPPPIAGPRPLPAPAAVPSPDKWPMPTAGLEIFDGADDRIGSDDAKWSSDWE
jgi:hypothetical protein